jgi:hypothetical protein
LTATERRLLVHPGVIDHHRPPVERHRRGSRLDDHMELCAPVTPNAVLAFTNMYDLHMC